MKMTKARLSPARWVCTWAILVLTSHGSMLAAGAAEPQFIEPVKHWLPPTSSPRTLPPGMGFDGPTAEPQRTGNGPGSDARAIARWNVVPHQVYRAQLHIGVVAFHMAGIEEVRFSLNGGPWMVIREMSLNPHSNTVEYWVTVDGRRTSDGPVEVRAVAVPKAGYARVLEPLPLVNNRTGSIPAIERWVDAQNGSDATGDGSSSKPFATIIRAAGAVQDAAGAPHYADNGTIHLKAGDYDLAGRTSYKQPVPVTNNIWLTIKGAPGLSPDQVRIVSSSSPSSIGTRLLRLNNLNIHSTGLANGFKKDPPTLWLDNVLITGNGRSDNTILAGSTTWTGGVYITDSTVTNIASAPANAVLARDVAVRGIGSDAFQNARMIVNCTVEDIDSRGTSAHPDVWQFHYSGERENNIAYGLTATRLIRSQGIFQGGRLGVLKDTAIVDCHLNNRDYPDTFYNVFQFCSAVEHMVIRNSTFVGPSNWRVDSGFTGKNIVVESTTFNGETTCKPAGVAGVEYLTAPEF